MIEYCNKYQEKIPLSFILGFYVTAVMGRWWEQFNSLPWPSRLALMLTSHIRGQDERSRLIRRTIVRYMCLGYVMTMTSISVPVRKRFPTVNHIVEAGTMQAKRCLMLRVKIDNNISPGQDFAFFILVVQKIL